MSDPAACPRIGLIWVRMRFSVSTPLAVGLSALLVAGLLPIPTVRASSEDDPEGSSRFRVVILEHPTHLARLKAELGNEGFLLLQKLNRRDTAHMRKGTRLVVPALPGSLEEFSPFPLEVAAAGSLSKVILVSQRVQAFAAYERGTLANWGPVSTGTVKQPTPNGLYHVNWKAPSRRSSINRNWLMRWYVNLHTSMGVALHQYAMPGRPASYGCIRLLAEDARWIYRWADTWLPSGDPSAPRAFGTPVVVFGEYDHSASPPWEQAATTGDTAGVSAEETEAALQPYLWVLEKRHRERKILEQSALAD
ncbi:MAG: hypothetical protein Kow001_01980 [Acidobacteriota bacterium]